MARALEAANRVSTPAPQADEALAAVIDVIVDPGATPTLHTVELERLAITWPALAGRLAALVQARGREVPPAWANALTAHRAPSRI